MHQQFRAAEIDDRHVLAPPPTDPAATADLITRGVAAEAFAFIGA
jgi:hypothetical protein